MVKISTDVPELVLKCLALLKEGINVFSKLRVSKDSTKADFAF